MKVRINGQLIKLNEKLVLGVGGEATVLRYQDRWAVKLYHKPTPERATKLQDLMRLTQALPSEVVGPLDTVWSETDNSLIGFVMPLLPGPPAALASLANRSFRIQQGVAAPQVVNLFLKMHQVVTNLHQGGLVIGDFNDLNVLFKDTEAYFIDVDSYQFGKYACPVATETYLDPALYNVDLGAKPTFTPLHDWYSYAVLLFRALLLVHPYGGTHRQWRTITDRACQRISVFDDDVTYPKIALNPGLLDEALARYFWQVFSKGQRTEFPIQLLQDYAASLTECSTCHNWFPASRSVCPVCQGLRLVVAPPLTQAGLTAERILATDGPILVCRVFGNNIFALAREGGMAVLYQKDKDQPARRTDLFGWQPGARYDFMDGVLVVNPAESTDLLLLKLEPTGVSPLTRTTTGQFDGKAVFATTDRHLYRTAGPTLLKGEIRFDQLVERQVSSILEGQSWFEVRTEGNNEIVNGFNRVFRDYRWFNLNQYGQHDLELTLLEAGEALLGSTTQPGLIVRFTRQAGVDYLRLDKFDADGRLQTAQRRPFNPDINYAGGVFAQGIALWPSNTGLWKESIQQQRQAEMTEAAPYLSSASQLFPTGTGLLIANETEVFALKMS